MQIDPHIQNPTVTPTSPTKGMPSQSFFGPSVDDVDIDGQDLETAAHTLGIGVEDLWRRIRNGQVMARSMRGKVYVYASASQVPPLTTQTVQTPSPDELPAPPTEAPLPRQIVVTQMEATLPHADLGTNLELANREISLLIDHLSLAKDENRDIIRFTRESMNRLTDMTDTMLQMKDDVISAREQQVEMLNERMRIQAEELRTALREKENLETLARVLMSETK